MRFYGVTTIEAEAKIYWIPERNLAQLQDRLDKLARKAQRLGVGEISYSVGQPEPRPFVRNNDARLSSVGGRYVPYTEKYREAYERLYHEPPHVVYIRFFPVAVKGSTPRIAGWTFVATLQHMVDEQGKSINILRVVPGFEGDLPEKYRTASPEHCDHCQRAIKTRKDTYILRNDTTGEYKQVGRSCTQDFLGGKNPQAVASFMEYLFGALGAGAEGEGGDFGGGRHKILYAITEFLEQVAACVRLDGWLSRSKARERDMGPAATADFALYLLEPPPMHSEAHAQWTKEKERAKPTEADIELADKAIEYTRDTLAAKPDRNDYEHNLYVAMTQPMIDPRLAGIVASAIPYYLREVEHQAMLRHERATSEYVGTEGERGDYYVTLLKVIQTESAWGTTLIHKLVTREGGQMTWFASHSTDMEIGQEYRITATIKKHEEYRGVKQTVVTRVVVYTDEGRKSAEEKEARKAERDAKRAERDAAKAAKEAAKAAKAAAKGGEPGLSGAWGNPVLAGLQAYAHELGHPVYVRQTTISGDDTETLESWLEGTEPVSRRQVECIASCGIAEPAVLDVDADVTVDGEPELLAGLDYGLDVPAVLVGHRPRRGWKPIW
jgi:hypothetical protein